MGSLIGAVSTKIVIQAGLLLIPARIDEHRVSAVLDPAAPYTRLAPDLAQRVRAGDGADDADHAIRGYHVVGIDHHEVRLRTVRPAHADSPAPLVIGNDLLRDSPLELDFANNRLHLLERHEVARASRGLVRVPLSVAPSGCLELGAMRDDGTAAIIALAPGGEGGGGSEADRISVRLGTATLQASPPPPGAHACSAGSLALNWSAFGRTRIIIDLPDGILWIAPTG